MRLFFFILQSIFFLFAVVINPLSAQEKRKTVNNAELEIKAAQSFGIKIIDIKTISVLDLQTAQKIALTDNPSLAAARARVSQAVERVYKAQSAYWPSLDVTAVSSHIRLSDNEHKKSLQSARIFNPYAGISDPEDYFTAGITAGWIIFNGFERKFSIAMARYGSRESREAETDAKRLILSLVAFSYHNAQLARENIIIAKADELFNRRQVQDAEARLKAGTGSLSDVLNFQVQANFAESERIRFQQKYEIDMHALAALLGMPDAAFPLELKLAGFDREGPEIMVLPEAEPLITHALKYRPDVLQSKAAVEQAEAAVGLARADFFPKVTLSGLLEGNRTNSGRFEGDDFGSLVALNFTFNLFAGGKIRAEVREAKQKEKEMLKILEDVMTRVSFEVHEALSQLNAARQQLILQRSNALLVRQNRDLVEKEYRAGQGSLVRLNEAQRNLTAARGRLALAMVGFRQTWHNLKTSTAQTLIPFNGNHN